MGGSFENGEWEEWLRREPLGSPWSITAAVHYRLQLAQGYNGAGWSICFFCCCHLIVARGANRDCCCYRVDLEGKVSQLFFDFQPHNSIWWQNWAQAMGLWQGSVAKMGNCVGHASLRALKLQLHSLISSPQKNFWTFFETTWRQLLNLAKTSAYSDIFLRTAPHHASQTFPDWETPFKIKVPAQMQGAKIYEYQRVKLQDHNWLVYICISLRIACRQNGHKTVEVEYNI